MNIRRLFGWRARPAKTKSFIKTKAFTSIEENKHILIKKNQINILNKNEKGENKMTRGRPRLEDYKTTSKANDSNKLKFNNYIKSFIQENPIVKKGSAVVLDAATMLSLKAIMSTGFPERKIDSVNHTDATFKAIKKKHKQTFHMNLGEYLSMVSEVDEVKYSMSLAVADYCCSLTGNDGSRPQEDIAKLFNNRLLGSPSLLATTFSWRTKGLRNYASVVELLKQVTKLSKDNGYIFEVYDGEAYTGMFYMLFKLTRKDAKKPIEIEEEPFRWTSREEEGVYDNKDKEKIAQLLYRKSVSRLTPGQKAHVTRTFNKQ